MGARLKAETAATWPTEAVAWSRQPANAALILASLAWTVVLALILTHRIFVTNDSMSNYAHVWYVSDRFWSGHGIPFRMPVLAHGDGLAFPYGFIPWMTAALLHPVLGDWVVTLWLVLGLVGLVAATFWAFPALRSGWWPAVVLLNPMLVEALLLGQLPFVWAAAIGFLAIGCWRRGAWWPAALLGGAAQATHAAVLMPIAGVIVLTRLFFERERGRLLGAYIVSLLIAAPAAWLVLISPAVEDVSRSTATKNLLGTVALRSLVFAVPFLLLALRRWQASLLGAGLVGLLLALNYFAIPVRHDDFAWKALTRTPDESLQAFTTSDVFRAGATYRILRVADGKIGMYDLIRAGARLDSEFFPESIDRRSWPAPAEYASFLQRRKVEYVIIYSAYDQRYRTNEHALLSRLVTQVALTPTGPLCATLTLSTPDYDVFSIEHDACLGATARH